MQRPFGNCNFIVAISDLPIVCAFGRECEVFLIVPTSGARTPRLKLEELEAERPTFTGSVDSLEGCYPGR